MKRTCGYRYRRWDPTALGGAGDWDYSKATCPYTGTTMLKRDGTATLVESEDECSKDIVGCEGRFGAGAVLPMYAFPGMSRARS